MTLTNTENKRKRYTCEFQNLVIVDEILKITELILQPEELYYNLYLSTF